jgi:hypothetical protein
LDKLGELGYKLDLLWGHMQNSVLWRNMECGEKMRTGRKNGLWIIAHFAKTDQGAYTQTDHNAVPCGGGRGLTGVDEELGNVGSHSDKIRIT